MNTVAGYAMSSWRRGYGDMEFVLDERDHPRCCTHLPATAMVQCDLVWPRRHGAGLVAVAAADPRGSQLDRLRRARAGSRLAGTELEFIVFRHDVRGRPTAALPRPDARPTSTTSTTRSSAPAASSRCCAPSATHMYAAGLDVEGAKGECNLGQHEIGFLYADALTTADNHVVYKNGRQGDRRPAGQGRSPSWRKYNEREGSSVPHPPVAARRRTASWCSGRTARGRRSTTTSSPGCWRPSPTSRCSTRRTSTPTSASPTARFAPTTIAWGHDNRTCAVRLVGHGAGARMENRVPGADVNPYLALAAMLAGGLHGIEHELELEPELVGNAYTSGRPRCPRRWREAREAFATSAIARAALGDEVVDHYAEHGRRRAGRLQRGRHRLGAAAPAEFERLAR